MSMAALSNYRFTVLSKTVAAGGQDTAEYSPAQDIVIKKIAINERAGTALNNVFIDIEIQGDKVTKQPIPASLFTVPWSQLPDLEINLPKSVQIKFTIINNTGGALNIDIVLAWKPA